MFSQETHNIQFQFKKKKITLNYPKSDPGDFFSKGLKNEFETDMVIGPSVLLYNQLSTPRTKYPLVSKTIVWTYFLFPFSFQNILF